MEKNFASAVIYVHNAEDRIGGFLTTVAGILEQNFEHAELICVNDCSRDGSLAAIRKVREHVPGISISVVNMSYFHGLELAMNAGMDLAIGDFVFEFDQTVMDFEPGLVMEVYRRCLEGFDIVSALPDKREKLSSRLFYRVFRHYADIPYEMATESFRILSRRVINRISSMNKTAPYRKAVYASCGLKTDTLRYQVQETVQLLGENGKASEAGDVQVGTGSTRIGTDSAPAGSGSARTGKGSARGDRQEKRYRFELAADALLLFTQVGYRFSMSMTILMMLISVFMIVYSLVMYFVIHPVEGWTTTILFLSVAFFGLFGILTIIIKYLQLLIDLVFKRKHYSFESIEKL